jgi:hypothetical protein
MNTAFLWNFLLRGYLTSIAVETPVLLVGLSSRHGLGRRLFAGVWLTACTYPIVILVLPVLMSHCPEWQYLLVAETFAPAAECTLFALAFYSRRDPGPGKKVQDMVAIILANLASFAFGVWAERMGWAWFLGAGA